MSDAFLVISSLALLTLSLGVVHTLLVGFVLSKNISEAAAQNGRFALLGQDTPSSKGSSGRFVSSHYGSSNLITA